MLSSQITVTPRFRRAAWIRWEVPMAAASPSPTTIRYFLSGWAILRPGGPAGARPGGRAPVGGPEVAPAPGREGLAPDAANAGAEDDVFLLEPQLVDGLEEPVLDHADAAAVAGLRRDLARPQILRCQLVHDLAPV